MMVETAAVEFVNVLFNSSQSNSTFNPTVNLLIFCSIPALLVSPIQFLKY